MENLNRMGNAEGIVFSDRTFTMNSHKSLLLAEAAKEEGLEAYAQLIRQGKVRAIGASNYTAARLAQALEMGTRPGYPS